MGDVKARPLYRACLSNDGPKVSWLRRVPGGTLLGRRHRLRNGHPPDQQDSRGVPRPHDAGEMQLPTVSGIFSGNCSWLHSSLLRMTDLSWIFPLRKIHFRGKTMLSNPHQS